MSAATSSFVYCLNTSTIRCGEVGLEEMIDVTAEAGYQAIEPWVQEIDAFVEGGGTLSDLAGRFRAARLHVANLIGFFEWGVDDEKRSRRAFEEAERVFRMAAELGCPFVAAPPMGIAENTDTNHESLAARYAQLIDLGSEYGVVPVVEFWGFASTLGRLGQALHVAAECGRAEACILADVFHMYKGSGHFEGLKLLGAKTLGVFHVNDYPAGARDELGDADRVYPGDGVAPLATIFRTLRAVGFCGPISLELFNESYWEQDALTVARTGLEKLKAITESL